MNLDNGVLAVTFSEESDFYAKEAGKPRHSEALGEVLESRFGVRPRLEFRVAGDADSTSDTPSPGTPAPVEPEVQKPRKREEITSAPAPDAPMPERESEARGQEMVGSGGSEGDDVIRDSREVFVMARELFDPGNQDAGS